MCHISWWSILLFLISLCLRKNIIFNILNPCLQYCISSLTAALFWCGDFHFLINLIFDVFDPYLYYYIPFINCSTLWCHRLWRRKTCYWNWMVLLELQKSLSRGIFRPFAPLTETNSHVANSYGYLMHY